MKNITAILLVFILFISINNILKSEGNLSKSIDNPIYFGLGTNINGGNLYIPIQIHNIRLEPFIGFSMNKNKADYYDSAFANITNNETLNYRLGLGGFYTFRPINSSILYAGLRVSFNQNFTENNYSYYNFTNGDTSRITISSNKRTLNSFIFGATFGGEYFLTKQLSLGVEAQLNYNLNLTPKQYTLHLLDTFTEYNNYQISTACLVFVRYYFNY